MCLYNRTLPVNNKGCFLCGLLTSDKYLWRVFCNMQAFYDKTVLNSNRKTLTNFLMWCRRRSQFLAVFYPFDIKSKSNFIGALISDSPLLCRQTGRESSCYTRKLPLWKQGIVSIFYALIFHSHFTMAAIKRQRFTRVRVSM